MTETAQPPPAQEKRQERRFQWITLVVLPLICVVLGAAIGYWVQQYSGRLRSLQYYASTSGGLIKKPDLQGKTLKVLLDDKEIANISTVQVFLFNLTDQDYEDVQIGLTFGPRNGKAPILVQCRAIGASEVPEILNPTNVNNGSVRYGYKLKVLNRSSTAVLVVNHIFEGEEAPPLIMDVQKKGLTITEMKFDQFSHAINGYGVNDIIPIASIVSCIVSCVLLIQTIRRTKQLNKLAGVKAASGN